MSDSEPGRPHACARQQYAGIRRPVPVVSGLRASGLVKAFGRRPAPGGHVRDGPASGTLHIGGSPSTSRSVSVQPPTADLQINEGNQLNGLMRERHAPHDKWRARNSCTFKFDRTRLLWPTAAIDERAGDGLREGRNALPRIAWQVSKTIEQVADTVVIGAHLRRERLPGQRG
jgi:hypothetical protein